MQHYVYTVYSNNGNMHAYMNTCMRAYMNTCMHACTTQIYPLYLTATLLREKIRHTCKVDLSEPSDIFK